nr:putative gtp-binding protein engb [Quercus suber]
MSGEAGLKFKLNKKLKIASGRSRNSKDGSRKFGRTLNNDRNGNIKRMNSDRKKRRIYAEQDMVGEVDYSDNERAPSKKFERTLNNDRNGNFKRMTSDGKKKRVYAEQDIFGEVDYSDNERAPSRKASSKKEQKQLKGDNKSSHSIWVSKRLEDATSETKRSSRKFKDTVKSAQTSNRTKTKDVDNMNVGRADSLKKPTKSKYDSSKRVDISEEKFPDVSPSKSAKKNVQEKRRLDEGTEVIGDMPKKKKERVIRIDPHDISNKRLDDGLVIYESGKEKKKDLEENTKMSKNAQFRTIQPSPSILSFVEENLLGRRRLIELWKAGYNTELSAPLDNIPFSTSSERERIEENMFRNKLTFFAAAKVSSSFPPPELPEIAFAGRSNVGKSSLLNSLTRQWGVVRTETIPASLRLLISSTWDQNSAWLICLDMALLMQKKKSRMLGRSL